MPSSEQPETGHFPMVTAPAPYKTAPPCWRLREEPSLVEEPPPFVSVFQQSRGIPSHPERDLGKYARLIHGPKDVRS